MQAEFTSGRTQQVLFSLRITASSAPPRFSGKFFSVHFSCVSCISWFDKMAALKNPKAGKLVPSLLKWFSANARDLPWRRTRDPYAVWISEIMLQQTQVKTVIPFWNRWLRELPTVESVANASSGKIHKLWEGLGYYTRVRNLQKAAQVIVKQHDGKFPNNFDDVLALPGIGRYTAGAILASPKIRKKRTPTRNFGHSQKNWCLTQSTRRTPRSKILCALCARCVRKIPARF
jgi:hypothetical protein